MDPNENLSQRTIELDERLICYRIGMDTGYSHDYSTLALVAQVRHSGVENVTGPRNTMRTVPYKDDHFRVVRAARLEPLTEQQKMLNVHPHHQILVQWTREALLKCGEIYGERQRGRIGVSSFNSANSTEEPFPGVSIYYESNGLGKQAADAIRRLLSSSLGNSGPGPKWRFQPVNTVGGRKGLSSSGGGEMSIAKQRLLGDLAVKLDSRRLEISAAIPQCQELVEEITSYQYIHEEGSSHVRMSAPSGKFDDLLIAVAYACVEDPRTAGVTIGPSIFSSGYGS